MVDIKIFEIKSKCERKKGKLLNGAHNIFNFFGNKFLIFAVNASTCFITL